MISWYLRRFKNVSKAKIRVLGSGLEQFEDRLTPVANFTAGAPFASNLTSPNALEWPIRAGDFNGDGKQDFVSFAGSGSSEIVSFFGNGAGAFTFKAKLDLAGFATPRTESFVVGDFTNPAGTGTDGLDDFAYIDSANNFVDIWASKGNGTFTLVNSISTSNNRLSMAAGDLNNDGVADLIMGRSGGGGPGNTPGEYEVLMGNGDGTFTSLERTATANLDFISSQPTITDMNGDGFADLVAINANPLGSLGRAGVYYGNGDGTFSFASTLKTAVNAGVNDHVVGDFNGDGLKDVALVTAANVDVYYQTSPGVFPTTPSTSFTLSTAPNELVASDIDFDGKAEIIVAPFSASDANLRVYSADATGMFPSGGGTAVPTAGENINLAVIDGNANGTPDLIVSQKLTGPASTKFQYFGNNNVPSAPQPSTVTVSASPNPAVFGSPITFTAKVAQFGAIATGTVDFVINGSVFATLPLDATGKAVLTTSGPFPVGTLFYSTHYNGDAFFNPGDSVGHTLTVNPLASALNVTFTSLVAPVPPAPGLSIYGANVPITATIAPVGGFAPTGSFSFFANSFPLGTVAVDATGKAVLNTVEIPASDLTVITATYTGDPIYSDSSITSTDTLQIFKLPTVTDVITSSNPAVFGEPVVYTIQVSPDPAVAALVNPIFSGTIALFDNDNVIATPNIDATGKATFTIPADYALGTHTIQAVFPVSANFEQSQSTQFDQIINKANSETVLTPDFSTITFGDTLNLTASVGIVAPGVGSPTGTVTFFQDFVEIATLDLDANGQAFLPITGLAAGSYVFFATYSGNDSVETSASFFQAVTVDPTDSNTTLTITPASSTLGTTVALDTSVLTAAGLPVDVGTVTFNVTFNGVPQAPIVVNVSSGKASTVLTGLPFGTGTVTAQYTGTGSINDSSAGPADISVTKAIPVISFTTPSPASSPLGTTTTFNLLVSPPNGVNIPLTGTVDLYDNGTLFTTVTLVSGAGTASRLLTLGNHNIEAKYSGDGNFANRDANPLLLSIFRPTDRFSVGAGAGGPDRVNVYDATGTVVFSPLFAFSPDYTSGVRVATADFNGDGVQDVAMGTGPGTGSRVRILDGKTGAPLADFSPFGETFTGGVFVNAGDVNGDFKADLVVTPDQRGGARIRLFDNSALVAGNSIVFPASLTSRADFIGIIDGNNKPDTSFRGGARAAIGDVDGDGFGDIVMSAGFGGGPRVATFSGKSLTVSGGPKLFGDFLAFGDRLNNGSFVAVGDIDGDGKADIAAGAGPGGGPRVAIFGAAQLIAGNPTKIADFFAGNTANRSGVPVAFRYLDADNRFDLIAGSGSGDDHVTAYAGTSLVGAFTAPSPILSFDAFSATPNPEDAFRGTFVG